MDISGKVLVVTGGGNGIGRQVVLEALRRGARVAAVDIREESLADTAGIAVAGDRLATFAVDITDREATAALPEQVIAAHGAVDGVVNVAGIIQPFVKLNDLDYATIERVINVNLYGTIHMVKAFLPLLLERPEAHVAQFELSVVGGRPYVVPVDVDLRPGWIGPDDDRGGRSGLGVVRGAAARQQERRLRHQDLRARRHDHMRLRRRAISPRGDLGETGQRLRLR